MPSPRELTYARVDHPATILGRTVLVGQDLHELADRIKNGCPASGWEGDPRMTLARYTPAGGVPQIELWRLEHDGVYRMEARLRPDASGALDPSDICRQLVERDARRGYDIKDAVDRHNASLQKSKDDAVADKRSAAVDKLCWALKKDHGIRSTWAAPTRKVGA